MVWKLFVAMHIFMFSFVVTPKTVSAAQDEGRLPAVVSAQYSAPGHGPELAVDANDSTLWVASLTPQAANNRVWFQLDLGRIRQVARLYWTAADGAPYPASAPKRYKVTISNDGTTWKTITDAVATGRHEPFGDVLLDVDARYVRLETTQINDGTGWSLGLKEIWVTGGRDPEALARLWKMRARMAESQIALTWQMPVFPKAKKLKLYRATDPTDSRGSLIARLKTSKGGYTDNVPNWTPYYYWVKAVDSKDTVLGTSSKVAAFARPAALVSDRVETFAFWYEAYKPSNLPGSTVSSLGNPSFVVGPGSAAKSDLQKFGIGILPYITLYQTADWTEAFPISMAASLVQQKIAPFAFYRNTVTFAGSPPGYVPSVFCRPGHVEYNSQGIQYTICPNSAAFRDKVLERVRNQLAGGVSGFFVDNGYEDDIAASSVCQSKDHRHYYGEQLRAADAFIGLLMEVTCAVKKQNPNGIIMVNGNVPERAEYYGLRLNDVMDGQLWESYLRTSYSTPKEHVYNWASVYSHSVELEKAWLSEVPQRMFTLSYPWNRDEAFFCYATAKLANLPWSANVGKNDPDHKVFGGHFGTYPELIDLRLGAPANPVQYGGEKYGEVYVRYYQKGFVVVNPTAREQQVVVPRTFNKPYRDVYAGTQLTGNNPQLRLPPESGRVYLY